MLKSNVNELTATTATTEATSVVIYDNGLLKSATRAEITGTGWTDLLTPLTQAKQGANNKPDFDYTNFGYAFDKNDATEILYLVVQLPHSYKEGTDIYPHLHWKRAAEALPTWTMKWRWYNNGDTVPALSAAVEVATVATGDYSEGNTVGAITVFPTLSGTGKKISSIVEIQLYRKANSTPDADVVATQFDLHYYADSLGSAEEYIKS